MGAMGVQEGSSYEDVPLVFRQKSGQLDWKKIASVDPEKIQETLDYRTLQDNVQHITFCDIQAEMGPGTVDSHFIKVFKLAQLTIEYLLFCQEQLAKVVEVLESKLNASEAQVTDVQSQLEACRRDKESLSELLRAAKKEVRARSSVQRKKRQQVSFPLATQCPNCPKMFVHPSYLESHFHRRHSQGPSGVPWTFPSSPGLYPQAPPTSWTVQQSTPNQQEHQYTPQPARAVWQNNAVQHQSIDPSKYWTDSKVERLDPVGSPWQMKAQQPVFDIPGISDITLGPKFYLPRQESEVRNLSSGISDDNKTFQSPNGLRNDTKHHQSTPDLRQEFEIQPLISGVRKMSLTNAVRHLASRTSGTIGKTLTDGLSTELETLPVRDHMVEHKTVKAASVVDSARILDSMRETEEALGRRLDSLHSQLQQEKSSLNSKQESMKEWQEEQMKRQQEDLFQIRNLLTMHLKSRAEKGESQIDHGGRDSSVQVQEALRSEVAGIKKQLQDQLSSFEEQMARSIKAQAKQWSLRVEQAQDSFFKANKGLSPATSDSRNSDQKSPGLAEQTEVQTWRQPLTSHRKETIRRSESSHAVEAFDSHSSNIIADPTEKNTEPEITSEEDIMQETTDDERQTDDVFEKKSITKTDLQVKLRTELQTELDERIRKLLGTEQQVTGLSDGTLKRKREQLRDQRQLSAQKYPGFRALREKCARLLKVKLKSSPKTPVSSLAQARTDPTPKSPAKSLTSELSPRRSTGILPTPAPPVTTFSNQTRKASNQTHQLVQSTSEPSRLAPSPRRSTRLVSNLTTPLTKSVRAISATQEAPKSSLRIASPQTSPLKEKPVKRLTFQIQEEDDESEADGEDGDNSDSESSQEDDHRDHPQFLESEVRNQKYVTISTTEERGVDAIKLRPPQGQNIARLAASIESQLMNRKQETAAMAGAVDIMGAAPVVTSQGKMLGEDVSSLSSIEDLPLNRTWTKEKIPLEYKSRRSSWDS